MQERALVRRAAALVLMAAMLASGLPLPGVWAAPAPQAVTPVDLNLWIHADSTLSMAGNTNEINFPASFTARQWNMTEGLQKDVCIDLVDVGGGQQGFVIELNVGWTFGFTQTSINVTARVKNVALTTTVMAERTYEFVRSGPSTVFNNSVWNLPVTGPRNCIMQTGHKLAVEFVGSSTIGTADYRNAHLAFRATDPVLPTAVTASSTGPAGTFYPNDLDANRDVIVKGSLGNAFDGALISSVTVQIRDTSGSAVDNRTASVNAGNYSSTWHYTAAVAGTYTAFVSVADTQGHTYNTTVGFVFAAYGLRMTAQGESGGTVTRYTTVGAPATFDLTVTNVGATPTTVQMGIETTVSPDWGTDFAPRTFPLDVGLSAVSSFKVTPANALGPGNSTQVTVVAQSQDDPAAQKAKASLATTTIIQPALVLRISPARTDSGVRPGEAAAFNFTIYNDGVIATDVLFTATSAPEGWDRELIGNGVVAEGNGWRLVGLAGSGNQSVTLAVTAPTNTANQTTFECTVTARSAENASALATFVGTTRLILGIELSQTSVPTRPNGPPGGIVNFSIEVRNTDSLNAHTITQGGTSVAEAATNLQGIHAVENGSISVFAPNLCCSAATADVITVVVHLPERIRAGTYLLTVSTVVDGDANKVAQVNLSLTVDTLYDFYIALEGEPREVPMPEGTATLVGTIVNNGNTNIVLNLKATFTQNGRPETRWVAKFTDDAGAELTPAQATMAAYSSRPIRVVLQAPEDAFGSDSRKLALGLERTGGGNVPPWELKPALTVTTSYSTATTAARLWKLFSIPILAAVTACIVAAYLGLALLRGPKRPRPQTKPAAPPAGAAPKKVASAAAGTPPAGQPGAGALK